MLTLKTSLIEGVCTFHWATVVMIIANTLKKNVIKIVQEKKETGSTILYMEVRETQQIGGIGISVPVHTALKDG